MSIGLAVNKEVSSNTQAHTSYLDCIYQVVVGVVYNFILDQLFAAKEGGGATLNGEPIHVSQCTG